MARREDVALEEIRQVRRRLSKRLAKAMREDRFLEELRQMGRRGREALKDARGNGRGNGKKSRGK